MRRARRAGFTLIEFLAVALIMVAVSAGVGTLLMAHWSAYTATLYQNRANLEARQALDTICDDIRMAGSNNDRIDIPNTAAEVRNDFVYQSGPNQITITSAPNPFQVITYSIPANNNPNRMLVRSDPVNGAYSIAEYVSNITIDYEYRQRGQDGQWTYRRVANPTLDIASAITTVYVTVAVTIPPSVTGGPAYTSTMASAIHFRAPYGANVS